jgi:hypothetical protein
MLIRGPISQDFFEQEPYSGDWLAHAVVFIALLAGAAALVYAMLNYGISPFEFDEVG